MLIRSDAVPRHTDVTSAQANPSPYRPSEVAASTSTDGRYDAPANAVHTCSIRHPAISLALSLRFFLHNCVLILLSPESNQHVFSFLV